MKALTGRARPRRQQRRRPRLTAVALTAAAALLLAALGAALAALALVPSRALSAVDFSLPDGTSARASVRGPALDLGVGGAGCLDVRAAPGAAASRGEADLVRQYRGLQGKRPWKVAAGDFDGDGLVDLLVGVYKTTPFDRNEAPRPFVYNVDVAGGGVRVWPKWLGSRLSGPFVDLAAGDVDGDGRAELLALMLAPEGEVYVASFGWSGFGFVGEALSPTFPPAGPVRLDRPGRAGLGVRGSEVVLAGVGAFRFVPSPPLPPATGVGAASEGGLVSWEGTLEGPLR